MQFYGNANENTKRLFRDRLKARATPTLALFDGSGRMGHTHSGANKSRLEFYLREFIGETDSDTMYPAYNLTGAHAVCSMVHVACCCYWQCAVSDRIVGMSEQHSSQLSHMSLTAVH